MYSLEKVDDVVWDLYKPRAEYIASAECTAGMLYWGTGRSIGELAMCRGKDDFGQMQFEGLRNKMGEDYLFTELHHDDSPYFGTWIPFLELGVAPVTDDKTIIMNWLLEQEIDIVSDRIDWLRAMPAHLRAAPSWAWILDQNIGHLAGLQRTQTDGFSDRPTLSFRQIMESRKAITDQ